MVLIKQKFGIKQELIDPFFESMAMDLTPKTYDEARYKAYIYGSAEVVGLMCLRVFVNGDRTRYDELEAGACALGSAYQKVNFLRDVTSDYQELGRVYFPGETYETLDDAKKNHIIADIEQDFLLARGYIKKLPYEARRAVSASFYTYDALLRKLKKATWREIISKRIRVNDVYKLALLARAAVGL